MEPRGFKVKWKTPIFILLLFLLFLLPKVYADSFRVQTANNFNIILLEDNAITFQHITITRTVDEFSVTLTPMSGGLNGSNSNLRMYQVTGVLRFTSENTTSLTAIGSRQGVVVKSYVNDVIGSNSFNVVNGDSVRIEWGTQGVDYVAISMGLLGLGIMIVTPVYSIYQIKVKKQYMWIAYSIALFAIGYGFVMGWLGG